jgi:hypothetical protein
MSALGIHERNRNVSPLPAGADTYTTRSAALSSSNRPGRGTNHLLTPTLACSTAAVESPTTRTWHPARAQPDRRINPNRAMRTNPPDADSDRMTAKNRAIGGPWRYEIRVRGPIGPTMMQEAFPTLAASRSGLDTLLIGPLQDQCALYGVIHQLEALGLQLLEIRRPPTGDPDWVLAPRDAPRPSCSPGRTCETRGLTSRAQPKGARNEPMHEPPDG